ncbi:reverse transcriptase domain-containing protein [Streptomyces sp. NBC_01233]|uniref:reverse transcriptase domain-containing protein n=1 Tax=Streptomyces sp. NBC_01233 TaxID=2903787 RepID=UPI002E0E1281|nr:reverse transcriptase domain-containing protein [Streptomyces sp. NBC_01233]WSP93519.1 reverse transcriptase domain-containing protein [Streptomyces sp. NBC_01233]
MISPLLANIALSALDEHLHRPWEPDGELSTSSRRERRGAKGLPSWRLVRYADDFVVMVKGTRQDAEALREEVAQVLAPIGLRLSEAKTQLVHLSEGSTSWGSTSSGAANAERTSGTSTPSSPTGPSGR